MSLEMYDVILGWDILTELGIILDFKAYITACYNHLLEKQPNTAGEETPTYYKKEDDLAHDRARSHIQNTLKEALSENIITKEEYKFMDPEDKNASTFYCNFKVHKKTYA